MAVLTMPRLFEPTVSAICEVTACSQYTGVDPIDTPPYSDVTAFVLGQWQRMPRFLAWPLRLVTVGFALSGLLTAGNFFHRLDRQRQLQIVESWRVSSIGPCRDFVRFYRSLALLALYSRTGNIQ
jgi:hypothetical protein